MDNLSLVETVNVFTHVILFWVSRGGHVFMAHPVFHHLLQKRKEKAFLPGIFMTTLCDLKC